jgi:hypothetical protein
MTVNAPPKVSSPTLTGLLSAGAAHRDDPEAPRGAKL